MGDVGDAAEPGLGGSPTSAANRHHAMRALSEENVAMRVAWEMRRRGWSQERMAQELTNAGCPTHQSAISKIVNPKADGSRRTISVDEMIAMSRVFGVPLEELPLPPETAEGRDLHDVTRTITQEARNAKESYAHFLLAWARLRHRLNEDDSRAAYEEFLTTRRVDTDTARQAIDVWLDPASWHKATSAYGALKETLQALGTGRDLTPPSSRHSVVADLLRLRELFATRIPTSPARVVPDMIYHFADVLVRTEMLDTAVPVIDAYARGLPSATDEVVAEIDRRLQQLAEREPGDRFEYLESLAARIGLQWKGGEPKKRPEDLAAQLGVSLEDYRDAKKIGQSYRETGLR